MPLRVPAVVLALLLGLAVLTPAPAYAGATEQAQRRLNQLGCDAGRADGQLGPHTRSAIIRFQAANRLGQDGRLNRATRSRLHGAQQVRCDRRPVVRSGSGRRVVISQRQNYVWLVRVGGGVVAQGPAIDNPGVLGKGSYRVGSYCGRAAKIRVNSSSSGSWWLPHFTRFAPCGVGFHRIPLSKSTGNQMHADWLLGTNMQRSAGCVRLRRGMAALVWDFATVGTRVVVR